MKTILCVDDEVAVLKCFARALGAQGYSVVTTENPTEALTILSEQDVDLVTLDVRMPKISGFEMYRQLKKKAKTIPVLFVTAYPASFSLESEPLVKMWREEFCDGNTDIIYKPFDIDDLAEKVAALIGPAGEHTDK